MLSPGFYIGTTAETEAMVMIYRVLGTLVYSTTVPDGSTPTFAVQIDSDLRFNDGGENFAKFTEAYVALPDVTVPYRVVVKSEKQISQLFYSTKISLRGL
ncbi:hypothetical protein PROFUN_05469 [Planoprotostelium fungivorum]|uniref:Uncharacterized protein n=1 Tax=Planoprotostelium fungivorum TaxID=1890364 RepID=A0A2P6NR20_9EUKA|nr:hypothetical protein PROFUN_05469 [Planoprotostelium fungivorum]